MVDDRSMERLSVTSAIKRYGTRVVLNDVDLSVSAGEVHGLIGPNGSGKSTLLKCIMGAEPLSSGDVLLNGTRINRRSPQARNRRGMSIKFQHAEVIPSLTVRHNIRLALGRRRSFASWILNTSRATGREDELMDALDIHEIANEIAVNLSHGEQQWLELGMALATDPSVLLLDEPTAGMSLAERAKTESALRKLTQQNRAIILVDHDLDFVKRFSDSITVLNDGEVVTSGSTDEVSKDPDVRRIYLGEAAQ